MIGKYSCGCIAHVVFSLGNIPQKAFDRHTTYSLQTNSETNRFMAMVQEYMAQGSSGECIETGLSSDGLMCRVLEHDTT